MIKKICKAFAVAFSMYSKIPMPQFTWASEDMRYHLIFFPFVGALIGAAEYGWFYFCDLYEISSLIAALICVVIPFLVTGGFHFDGFMDVCDALHSYQDREKKLQIMKDPHIGAFSVICAFVYVLLSLAGAAAIYEYAISYRVLVVLCCIFPVSRILSAMSVVTIKGAKEDGMLRTEKEESSKSIVFYALVAELIALVALALWLDMKTALVLTLSMGLSYLYYYRMSEKHFGGITGDLAGYFVCIAELASALACSILFFVMA